jgi:hypothetical protein
MGFYAMSIASDTEFWRLGDLPRQAEIGAVQWLCPTIPLCLLLKTLDGIPNLRGIVPRGSGPLLKDPSTRGTNTTAEFRIGEHLQQFDVNCLAFLLQGLELP